MTCFVNPFAPDLDPWKPGRCSGGYHESEAQHEKAVALAQSRQARRAFIAETCRNVLRLTPKGDAADTAGASHSTA